MSKMADENAESLHIFDINVCKEHTGTGSGGDEARLVGVANTADVTLECMLDPLARLGLFLFVHIVHHLVVLLLDTFNSLLLVTWCRSSIRNRFLNDLILFVLPVKLDL